VFGLEKTYWESMDTYGVIKMKRKVFEDSGSPPSKYMKSKKKKIDLLAEQMINSVT